MLVPPPTALTPDATLDQSPTLVRTMQELHRDPRVEVSAVCGTTGQTTNIERGGVHYVFARTDELATVARDADPDLVHVHGLGFVRALWQLDRTLPRKTPVVVQHHGEPPGSWRTIAVHRLLRRRIGGYVFTGAEHGQADPFRAAGILGPRARLFDVPEAASLLDTGLRTPDAIALPGSPAILWVGRLIDSKDPITAVNAFAMAADRLPDAHLHLLATERTRELVVRERINALGPIGARITIHQGVAHDQMPRWYAAADVYFSTTHREGSNYSMIEAISFGCPPAVTAIPSHRSLVGGMGALFAPGDVGAAADALVAATQIDRADVVSWSTSTLSWTSVADRLVQAYQTVLGPAQTGSPGAPSTDDHLL
jgi:glycosyltransferase involved in cell wall biosynthesis